MNDEILNNALKALSDPDPEVRKGAAFRMHEFNDKRVTAPLINALDDEDIDVRAYSASSLGILKSREATERLISMSLNDDNIDARAAALNALAEIGDQRAIPALEQIEDTDLTLRAKAIVVLGELGYDYTPTFKTKILAYLRDDEQPAQVHYASIVFVEKMKIANAVEIIDKFLRLRDAELDLVLPTLHALTAIGTQAAKQVIENNFAYLSNLEKEVAFRLLQQF
jgi:HEAT repeat protein